MLKIVDLGPTALAEYDPSGEATRKFHASFSDREFYNQPSHFLKKGIQPNLLLKELESKILKQYQGNRYDALYQYEMEMISKYGPQGGHITRSKLESILKTYYENAELPRSFKLVRRGVKALVRELKAIVRLEGLPQVYTRPFVQNTAGGLPTCLKKNVGLGSYLYAHSEGFTYFGALQPALPAARRYRNKDRIVFVDSCLNVDRINSILTTVRNWFKQHFPELFAALHNPEKYLWPKIYRCMTNPKLTNLETDFKSMDTWVDFEIAKECMLPVFEVLLTPSDYLNFSCMVEAYFKQELLVGEQLWTGWHTLFSGQTITQDVENFYDICLYLGCFLELRYSFKDFLELFVMVGDDVLAFIPKRDIENLYNLVVEETEINKVVLSPEKTRKNTADIRFCRCVYDKSLPVQYSAEGKPFVRPAYSLVLATNSIVQPESENERFGIELSAIIQRADNAAGAPLWRTWAEWILSKLNLPFLPTDEQFKDYQLSDWWARVYGETYSLLDSPTYRLWDKLYRSRS